MPALQHPSAHSCDYGFDCGGHGYGFGSALDQDYGCSCGYDHVTSSCFCFCFDSYSNSHPTINSVRSTSITKSILPKAIQSPITNHV